MGIISAQITDAGVVTPDYADILQQIKIGYWAIYGSDANLDDDSQDGQYIAIFANGINDCNQAVVDTYNGFSPATAQGTQLSSLVKLNGIAREIPSNSAAVISIGGQAGSTIDNGIVGDNLNLGTQWTLPAIVNIPNTGTVDVTATCTQPGNTTAAPNTLTTILTPTRGWQTATNAASAAPGLPVEDDADLRSRQSRSVALPALTVIESIYASIAAISGVGRLTIYENDTDLTDGNGIPSHSISPVVSGGDVTLIGQAIALKKTPGSGTYGTTSVIVLDNKGVPNTIHFFELALVELVVVVHITPLFGYVSTTGDSLVAAVAVFENDLDIGEDSYLARLYSPANLSGTGLGATYVVTAITQGIKGGAPPAAADIVIAFNAAVTITIDDITLVVA